MSAHDFFWSNGYLPIGRVSAPSIAESLKVEAGRLLARRQISADHVMRSPGDGHVRVALHLCHLSEAFRRDAINEHVVSTVRGLLGEEPVVLTSLLFNKPPHVGLPLGLHQDLPYYPYLADDDLITCWTALDAVDSANGCVEYLPGSHRSRWPHRETGQQQALDVDPQTIDVAGLISVPLRPGEAVLHHGLTVHRSGANTSGRPRAGLATLYIRAGIDVLPGDFPYGVITLTSDQVDAHAHA